MEVAGHVSSVGKLSGEIIAIAPTRKPLDLRDMICTIKQSAWKNFQRQRLSDNGVATLTLGYDLLQNSWLATAFEADEDKRTTFGPKTWMKDIVQ